MAQKHIKVYREYFGIGDQDIVLCEVCGGHSGVEIHHVFSRRHKTFDWKGETYDINDILNLVGLCRQCHILAHSGEHSKEFLIYCHKYKLQNRNPNLAIK